MLFKGGGGGGGNRKCILKFNHAICHKTDQNQFTMKLEILSLS